MSRTSNSKGVRLITVCVTLNLLENYIAVNVYVAVEYTATCTLIKQSVLLTGANWRFCNSGSIPGSSLCANARSFISRCVFFTQRRKKDLYTLFERAQVHHTLHQAECASRFWNYCFLFSFVWITRLQSRWGITSNNSSWTNRTQFLYLLSLAHNLSHFSRTAKLWWFKHTHTGFQVVV